MSEHDDEATGPIEEDEPTADDRDEQGSSREAEILAARRESLARLADAGMDPFALTLETALGVAEPDAIVGIHREFGDLAPGTTGDGMRTVAGRIVHRRDMGKLTFLVIRDRTGDIQLFCNAEAMDPAAFAPARRGRPRRHRRGQRPGRDDEEGRALDLRGAMGDAHEGLRPLPEKWHGLKDPDLQQRRRYLHLVTDDAPRALLPGACRRPADDAPRAGRARVRRVRGPDAAARGGRRERPAVHHASTTRSTRR